MYTCEAVLMGKLPAEQTLESRCKWRTVSRMILYSYQAVVFQSRAGREGRGK